MEDVEEDVYYGGCGRGCLLWRRLSAMEDVEEDVCSGGCGYGGCGGV